MHDFLGDEALAKKALYFKEYVSIYINPDVQMIIKFPSCELCHRSVILQTTPSVQECKAYFVQRACVEHYACIHSVVTKNCCLNCVFSRKF